MNRVCYPQVPQRVAQNAILLFWPVKFNFCRKKSAAKFLRVKTSSGKVVATSFLYLTVCRWTADVPTATLHAADVIIMLFLYVLLYCEK